MQTVFNRNWPTGVIRLDRNPSTRERDKLSLGKILSLVTVVRLIVNDVLFAVLHSIAVVGKLPLNPTCARPTMSAFLSDFIGGIN
jgi:hypothetical protein